MRFQSLQSLLLLVFIRRVTIRVPLSLEEMYARLAATLTTDVISETSLFWSYKRRYSGYLNERSLFVRGPLTGNWILNSRNRPMCLVTRGKIASDSHGTALKLVMHPTAFDMFSIVLALAWIPGWVMALGEREMFLVCVFPVMFLYTVMTWNFGYEAALIVKLMKQVLLHPPQNHINPLKFSL